MRPIYESALKIKEQYERQLSALQQVYGDHRVDNDLSSGIAHSILPGGYWVISAWKSTRSAS